MTARLLDGKRIADELIENIRHRVRARVRAGGREQVLDLRPGRALSDWYGSTGSVRTAVFSKAGDRVIIAGLQKARPGATVQVSEPEGKPVADAAAEAPGAWRRDDESG